jgi:hypothetical protein
VIAVSLLISGALAASLSEPGPEHPMIVSGRATPKRSDSGSAVRWWRNRVKITLDASVGDIGADAEDAVRGAFGTWLASGENLPRLDFDLSSARRAVTLAPDGENRVYFAPITVPGHENDLAITLAYTRSDSGEVTEADLVINARHAFAMLRDEGRSAALSSGTTTASGCKGTYDVQSVLTHEVGHFFGLGEDTTDRGATMYFSTTPCDLGKRDLSTGDSGEMSNLYATGVPGAGADSEAPGSPVSTSCAMRPAPADGAASGLGLILALTLGGWLRRQRQ